MCRHIEQMPGQPSLGNDGNKARLAGQRCEGGILLESCPRRHPVRHVDGEGVGA